MDTPTPEERAAKAMACVTLGYGRVDAERECAGAIRDAVAAERKAILQELIVRREKQIAALNFDYACGFRDSIDFIRDRNLS